MRGLICGVRRELGRNAPATARAGLAAFEKRLALSSTNRKRKKFERELESYLAGKSYLRAAARRHLSKEMLRLVREIPPLMERVVTTLARTKARSEFLRDYKMRLEDEARSLSTKDRKLLHIRRS